MKNIEILFNGKNEILNVIDNNSSIIGYLGVPNSNCALIGSEIKPGRQLGKGAHGAAYEITLPGMGTKKYVMKINELIMPYFSRKTKGEIIEMLANMNLTYDDIKILQISQEYINYFENADESQVVKVVMPPEMCRLTEDVTFPAIPKLKPSSFRVGDNTIVVERGSYLCNDQSFSEYIIGSYLGKIYRENKCINFFDVHAMITCGNGDTRVITNKQTGERGVFYNQYIFMDKIDGGFRGQSQCVRKDLFKGIPEDQKNYAIDSVFVQTIFAIVYYQDVLQLSHNDLHDDNVFVEYVTKDTKFNGGYVAGADFYHYRYHGKDLYFPACPMLSKIGDFGLSVKYSKPIVGCKNVMEDGYEAPIDNTGEVWRAFCPNSFIPSYDSLYFTLAYSDRVSRVNNGEGYLMPGELTPLLNKCLQFLAGDVLDTKYLNLYGYYNSFINSGLVYNNLRPVMEKLATVKTAKEILEGPIAEYYRDLPTKGKIVTLGVL